MKRENFTASPTWRDWDRRFDSGRFSDVLAALMKESGASRAMLTNCAQATKAERELETLFPDLSLDPKRVSARTVIDLAGLYPVLGREKLEVLIHQVINKEIRPTTLRKLIRAARNAGAPSGRGSKGPGRSESMSPSGSQSETPSRSEAALQRTAAFRLFLDRGAELFEAGQGSTIRLGDIGRGFGPDLVVAVIRDQRVVKMYAVWTSSADLDPRREIVDAKMAGFDGAWIVEDPPTSAARSRSLEFMAQEDQCGFGLIRLHASDPNEIIWARPTRSWPSTDLMRRAIAALLK